MSIKSIKCYFILNDTFLSFQLSTFIISSSSPLFLILVIFDHRSLQSSWFSNNKIFRSSKFSMITWRSCFLPVINNNFITFNLSNCIVLSIFRLSVTYKLANIRSNVIKSLKTSYFIKFCRSLRFRNMMKIRSNIRTLFDLHLIKFQIVIRFIFALIIEALLDLL